MECLATVYFANALLLNHNLVWWLLSSSLGAQRNITMAIMHHVPPPLLLLLIILLCNYQILLHQNFNLVLQKVRTETSFCAVLPPEHSKTSYTLYWASSMHLTFGFVLMPRRFRDCVYRVRWSRITHYNNRIKFVSESQTFNWSDNRKGQKQKMCRHKAEISIYSSGYKLPESRKYYKTCVSFLSDPRCLPWLVTVQC